MEGAHSTVDIALFQAIAIPCVMFFLNAGARKFLSLQQSPATDLTFVFLVLDFALISDPDFATKALRLPITGTNPMFWLAVLTALTLLAWLGLLTKHERPIHVFYSGRGKRSTIDTCVNNVLYSGPEVHHEAQRKPRGTGTPTRASAGVAQGRTAAR